MSHSNIDNKSATETFVSAYEASQEPTPRARRRLIGIETTAQLFARERLLDAAEQDSERAIIDDLDENAKELHEISTRPANYLDPTPVHDDLFEDEYTLMAERYGANSDIAMSDLIEFGGTVDSSKLFKKSILSESEKELVNLYADDPDCNVPVNPMKETFTKPETLTQIKRRLHRRYRFYRIYPEQLRIAVEEEIHLLQETFVPKAKYVPVKPALEPVDQDERREAHDLSREFKRRSAKQLHGDVDFRNDYPYNLDRRLRSQCPTSIRYQSWSEQLPFCSEAECRFDDHQEDTWFEASIRQMEEEWENEKETDLQFELDMWEEAIELIQDEQRGLREAELLEEEVYEIDPFDPYLYDQSTAA